MAKPFDLVRKWGTRTAFSVGDEGILSGANFGMNILLARWLAPGDYGSFAVTFSLLLFAAGFHNALILEPMTVLGPSGHNAHLPQYLGTVLRLQMVPLGILGLILAGVGIALKLWVPGLGALLLALALATPLALVFWFFRRACYVMMRPDQAIKASFVYSVVVIPGLLLMKRTGHLSLSSAFVLIALASIAGALTVSSLLRLPLGELAFSGGNPASRTVLAEHWGYGRWVMGQAVVFWVGTSAYTPLVAGFVGLSATGALRAMQNLVLPLQHTLTAIGLLLLPSLSSRYAARGEKFLRNAALRVTVMTASLAAVYVALMLLEGTHLVAVLYGTASYEEYVWLLPYLGGAAVVAAAGQGLGLCVRAVQRPDVVFWSQLAQSALTLTLGVYLVSVRGLLGAAICFPPLALVGTLITALFVLHRWRHPL